MTITNTYTQARANLAELCNKATHNREIILINRRGAEDVALIAASELSSISETAHLLRSPKNSKRLLSALRRAEEDKISPSSFEELKKSIKFSE